MKETSLQFIVSFESTHTAIAMDKAASAAGVPGKLIPVPRQITASCGLAWMAPAEDRAAVEAFIAENGLEYGQFWELEF